MPPMTMRRTFVLTLAPSNGLVLSLGLSGPGDDPDDAGGPSTGEPPAEPLPGQPAVQHVTAQPA